MINLGISQKGGDMTRTLICIGVLAVIYCAWASFIFGVIAPDGFLAGIAVVLVSAVTGLLSGVFVPTPRTTGFGQISFEKNKYCGWVGTFIGSAAGILVAQLLRRPHGQPVMITATIVAVILACGGYGVNQSEGL